MTGMGSGSSSDTQIAATTPLEAAFARLRKWSADELHLHQSVRHHEPIYKNPAALRADVRLVLDELVKARIK